MTVSDKLLDNMGNMLEGDGDSSSELEISFFPSNFFFNFNFSSSAKSESNSSSELELSSELVNSCLFDDFFFTSNSSSESSESEDTKLMQSTFFTFNCSLGHRVPLEGLNFTSNSSRSTSDKSSKVELRSASLAAAFLFLIVSCVKI